MKRIPSLDGIRAISIILVLLAHSLGTRGFLQEGTFLPIVGDLGNLGVRLFFVISGYVITSLLIREESQRGRISLKAFYFRRVFRILPPLWGLLAGLWISSLIGGIDLLAALSQTVNYPIWGVRSFFITHLWSLSTEEQFYLLWPATIRLFGGPRAIWGALAFIVASPLARMGIYLWTPSWYSGAIGHTFETTGDAIACGCVMAGWSLISKGRMERLQKMIRSRWALWLPLAVLVVNRLSNHPMIAFTVGWMLLNALIALWIYMCTIRSGELTFRLLNSRPLVFLGTLSYSLYLWQQVFLHPGDSSRMSAFPYNIMASILMAWLSYYVVERPSFTLRDRIRGKIFSPSHEPTHPTRTDGIFINREN